MIHSVSSTSISRARRAYQRPRLIKRGSVQQLTLKIGSISDGMSPHQ